MNDTKDRSQDDDYEVLENYDFSDGIRGRFYQPQKVPTAIGDDLRQQQRPLPLDKAVEWALSDEEYLAELEAWDSFGDEVFVP